MSHRSRETLKVLFAILFVITPASATASVSAASAASATVSAAASASSLLSSTDLDFVVRRAAIPVLSDNAVDYING